MSALGRHISYFFRLFSARNQPLIILLVFAILCTRYCHAAVCDLLDQPAQISTIIFVPQLIKANKVSIPCPLSFNGFSKCGGPAGGQVGHGVSHRLESVLSGWVVSQRLCASTVRHCLTNSRRAERLRQIH